MKINDLSRKILVYCDLNADIAYTNIARALRCREYTVRRALDRILAEGYFTRRGSFNLFRMGLIEFNVYLTFDSQSLSSRERILRAIESSPGVKWLQELTSGYHALIGYLAPTAREVSTFIDALGAEHGSFILEKSVSTVASYHYFGRRYISPGARPFRCIESIDTGPTNTLDEIDWRLLKAMSDGNYLGAAQLSRKLKLPPSTIQFRIERLKKEGILLGFTYNLVHLPPQVNAFRVHIHTRGNGAKILGYLKKMAADDPSIVYVIKCLASWDYEVIYESFDHSAVLDLGRRLVETLGPALLRHDILPLARIRKGPEFPFPGAPSA